MTARHGPSRRDPHLSGLEAWLIGTRPEVNAATAALADAGRLLYLGDRHPMTGADAGRFRQYLRLTFATTPTNQPAPAENGAALIDLDTARNARRTGNGGTRV